MQALATNMFHSTEVLLIIGSASKIHGVAVNMAKMPAKRVRLSGHALRVERDHEQRSTAQQCMEPSRDPAGRLHLLTAQSNSFSCGQATFASSPLVQK